MAEERQRFTLKEVLQIIAVLTLIAFAVPLLSGEINTAKKDTHPLSGNVLNSFPSLRGEDRSETPQNNPQLKPEETDPYEGWALYTNKSAKIRFGFPPGWNVAERLPKPGSDTGQYLTLTVSAVDQNLRQEDPTPFKDSLGLFITFDTAESVDRSVAEGSPLFGKLPRGDVFLESIEVNGGEYKLVGIRRDSNPNTPITQVEMMFCLQNGDCSWHIRRADGSYLDLTIASQGNTSKDRHKVDLKSADYEKIKLILKSMQF